MVPTRQGEHERALGGGIPDNLIDAGAFGEIFSVVARRLSARGGYGSFGGPFAADRVEDLSEGAHENHLGAA